MKETQSLNFGLIGANGRLGREIASLSKPYASFTRQFPAHPDPQIDIYIDVSNKDALKHNLSVAIEARKGIVIGTTGHEDLSLILEASQKIPIFYTPNFSLGFALMKKLSRELAQSFPENIDIDLIEIHHNQKKDAPSGSALSLAKAVEQVHPSPVRIHSIRSGQTIGEHTLSLNLGEEKITFSHQVHNRKAFAKGALRAAMFLQSKPPNLYSMDDLDLNA